MRADIVVDYAFGDAGKGATVDLLTRRTRPDWIVRFNGGAQAAHNVVTPAGVHHCFHQFGSGLLADPTVRTYLTEHVLFDPIMAEEEQSYLREVGVNSTLMVHPEAVIVTPWHVAMNRLRETIRTGRHGSCGMGIGEARGDYLNGEPTILVRDVTSDDLKARLRDLFLFKIEEAQALLRSASLPSEFDPMLNLLLDPRESTLDLLVERYSSLQGTLFNIADYRALRGDYLIFEGAQGVLLDERVGFHPHTTWTDTTPANALSVLDELGVEERHLYGVLRAYSTRHGAGPLPTEKASTRDWAMRGEHNGFGEWQGNFRTGWFDLPLAQYAIKAAGKPDSLVLTCLDRLPQNSFLATGLSGSEFPDPPSRELSESDSLWESSQMTGILENLDSDKEYTWSGACSPEEVSDIIRSELSLPNGWDSFGPRSTSESKVPRGSLNSI